ncbi:hypothetical protein STANM309S_03114 [Streptomyces tanashiensis]
MPERIPGGVDGQDRSRAFVGGAEVFGGQDELLDPRALKGERVQESQDCRRRKSVWMEGCGRTRVRSTVEPYGRPDFVSDLVAAGTAG